MNANSNFTSARAPTHTIAQEVERLQKRIDALSRDVRSQHREDTVSIVCFSGEWDRLFAAFVIANGALAMGQEVHMFFTFWASAMLRDRSKRSRPQSFFERLMGSMLPSGPEQAPLSKMNWGGLGKRLIRRRMKQRGIEQLTDLIERAQEMGVHMHLCEMTSELLGLDREALISDQLIDTCGVATFLSTALRGKTVLFI